MIDLFYRGEPFFMSVLLVSLLYVLACGMPWMKVQRRRQHLWFGGLFAMIFGIFSQFLGIYGALITIRAWGSTTPEIFWTGIGTSFIPAIFGTIIFLLALLLRWRFAGTTAA